MGSEAIGSVCLPPNCAHVLMDSVLHYSADPGLSQRPQLQRNRARSMRPCVCVCLHLSDYVITVWQYYFTIYLNSSALSVRRGLLIMLNPVVKLMKNAQNSFIIIVWTSRQYLIYILFLVSRQLHCSRQCRSGSSPLLSRLKYLTLVLHRHSWSPEFGVPLTAGQNFHSSNTFIQPTVWFSVHEHYSLAETLAWTLSFVYILNLCYLFLH